MKKPRIIKGICEFCGIPAEKCMHYRTGDFVDSAKTDDKKIDLYKKLSNKERIADIVIPHHNRHDCLKECLDRLPNDIFNIVIISGGSFASNCNKGSAFSETENIIFLNDDTLPDPKLLIEACENKADIVGFTQTIPSEGKTYFGVEFYLESGYWKARMTEDPAKVKTPCGFAFKIKTNKWGMLKGFDEDFYNGGEDSDFFIRAIDKGLTFDFIKTPMIHKHSQSDGRLTFAAENQKLLDKKWPNEKLIKTLKLGDSFKPLKILLANNHLDSLAGSETWTYAIFKELERAGHEVNVYTKNFGKVSMKMKNVIGDNLVADRKYDLMIINHNSCLRSLRHVPGFKIFTSHGVFPTLEQPEEGADKYVAITPEVQEHLAQKGFASEVIYNGVDTERFKSYEPANEKLKNILCLCKGKEAAGLVKKACDELGLNFRWIKDFWAVEKEINKADLVVSLGRGVMEAMACEREVVILDSRAYMDKGITGDGIVRVDDIQEVMNYNYSGRARKSEFTVRGLMEQLGLYDPEEGKKNRQHILKHHDIKNVVKKYLKIYEDNRNNQS